MSVILTIDDEQHILDIINKFFTKKGFDVKACLGGEEGMAFLESGEPFDVAILDMKMPVVDGPTLFKYIREKHEKVPIIILTGSLGQKSRELGPDVFMVKPIDLIKLHEEVDRLIADGK